MILSEVLSPGFYLDSSVVRNVLRGWIAHGVDDSAAIVVYCRVCSKSTSSSECCWFLRGVTRLVGLSCIGPPITLVFQQVPVDLSFNAVLCQCPRALAASPTQRRLRSRLLFFCKTHRQLGSCFQNHFLHRSHRVRCAKFVARALVRSFHAKDKKRGG